MSLTATASGGSAAWFTTTHWSIIWNARDGSSPASDAAREKLCAAYWRPLYGYLRRKGYKREDAQDLTQEFLNRLLQKQWLSKLQHQNGKFRSFLLTFLENFLSDQRDYANAQKRGGGKQIISLDAFEAEERDFIGPADGLTAEQVFERRWAREVMDRAVAQLESEYAENGNAALFAELRKLQPGEHAPEGYAAIGARLGMTENGVKSAVHRMRRRHGALLRAEVRRTVGREGEVEDEIGYLMSVLGS